VPGPFSSLLLAPLGVTQPVSGLLHLSGVVTDLAVTDDACRTLFESGQHLAEGLSWACQGESRRWLTEKLHACIRARRVTVLGAILTFDMRDELLDLLTAGRKRVDQALVETSYPMICENVTF